MFTIPNDAVGMLTRVFISSGITYDVTIYPQIEVRTIATSYEPYTSSTLNLPVSTYFPTGMKSAGSVYDELTETKAITRFVKYTITGTEDVHSWGQNYGTHYGGALNLPSSIAGMAKGGSVTNGIASMGYAVKFVNNDKTIYLNAVGDRMSIINDAFASQEQWLQGITGLEVILELSTPTETPITTEDANEALSLLMGKSVSSSNANQLINIITKGE